MSQGEISGRNPLGNLRVVHLGGLTLVGPETQVTPGAAPRP